MKKLFTLLLALCATVATWANGTEINGIYYLLDGDTATVTYTGSHTYSGNSYSGSIIIPSSVNYLGTTYRVTSIGNYAFGDCTGLTSITIGNGVTSIGEDAFYDCTGLTSVTIPNSVTSIGNFAFYGCTGLTSITIGNSVTSIGGDAFYGCTGLIAVHISDLAAWCKIQFDYDANDYYYANPLELAHHLYLNNQMVTNMVIPNSVTSIGNYAFYGLEGLTSVTIPTSVTSIGYEAFRECSNLKSVTIPSSVTTVGMDIFEECYNIDSITAPAAVFDIPETGFNTDDENEYWSGEWAYYTKKLRYVNVNSGTMTDDAIGLIKRSAQTLTYLDLSNTTNTSLADQAFYGCYKLQHLGLPKNLTNIGYEMAAECVYLKDITIPASVLEIGDRAFENCRSIKSINFAGSAPSAPGRNLASTTNSALTRIGNWAFYNAHSLQNLVIPESVTEIGDGAFYGCTYLDTLSLPSQVASIGDNCFALCSKLNRIDITSVTPPTIQAKTFYDVSRQIPVYVPAEAVDSYKNDPYWGELHIVGSTTGIADVMANGSQSVQKFIQDGKLYIIRGGHTYDASGREVK